MFFIFSVSYFSASFSALFNALFILMHYLVLYLVHYLCILIFYFFTANQRQKVELTFRCCQNYFPVYRSSICSLINY